MFLWRNFRLPSNLYVANVCIIILLHLIGQLGELGPVKSTLPEQDVAGVRSVLCIYNPCPSNTRTLTHSLSLSLTHTHSLVPRPLPVFQCWEWPGDGATHTLTHSQ